MIGLRQSGIAARGLVLLLGSLAAAYGEQGSASAARAALQPARLAAAGAGARRRWRPATSAPLRLRGGSSGGGGGPLVIGIDGGTESIRAGVFSSDGKMVAAAAAPYTTSFPRPGWAEQSPADWYRCLGEAVRAAVAASAAASSTSEEDIRERVQALCADTTCCTVVALDEAGDALRPALLWMDSRSAPQTERILKDCMGMDSLKVNCNGEGPLRFPCILS